MLIIDETTTTGEVRAAVRNSGRAFNLDNEDEKLLALFLPLADFLQLPDDTAFIPALEAAVRTPTQLKDAASIARVRDIAAAAGRGEAISTLLPGLG
jgi:hypothetical protein